MNPGIKNLLIGLACLVIIAFIAMVIFGIWGDLYVTHEDNRLAYIVANVQWESIAAGLLGLSGGLFVIFATQRQIAVMRETTNRTIRQANMHRTDAQCWPLENTKHVIEETSKEFTSAIQDLENERHKGLDSHDINELAVETYNAAMVLNTGCVHLQRILDTHGVTSFGFKTHKAISNIVASETVVNEMLHNNATRNAELRAEKCVANLANAKNGCLVAIKIIDAEIAAIRKRHGAAV